MSDRYTHPRTAGLTIEQRREWMKRLLGTGWMNAHEASEAIPPAYTRHIGEQLLQALEAA